MLRRRIGGPTVLLASARPWTLSFGTTVDEPTSFAILDRFAEAGGTLLDTANHYARWVPGARGDESELLLGRWLRSARGPGARSWPPRWAPGPTRARRPRRPANAEGLSAPRHRAGGRGQPAPPRHGPDRPATTRTSRTGRSRWRRPSRRSTASSGTAPWTQLGRQRHRTWRLARARRTAAGRGLPGFTRVQQRHTYLRPRDGRCRETATWARDEELLDYVRAARLTLMAYGTLMAGAYSRPDQPLPERYDHPGPVRAARGAGVRSRRSAGRP